MEITNQDYHIMSFEFDELLLSGKASDMRLLVDGVEFKVHKTFLVIQSSIFKEMIFNDIKGGQGNVFFIEGVSVATFKNLLQFCYTGRVWNEVNVLELFEAAAKFRIFCLQEFCHEEILKNIKQHDALTIYKLAFHASDNKLKQAAMARMSFEETNKCFMFEMSLLKDFVSAKQAKLSDRLCLQPNSTLFNRYPLI